MKRVCFAFLLPVAVALQSCGEAAICNNAMYLTGEELGSVRVTVPLSSVDDLRVAMADAAEETGAAFCWSPSRGAANIAGFSVLHAQVVVGGVTSEGPDQWALLMADRTDVAELDPESAGRVMDYFLARACGVEGVTGQPCEHYR